MERRVAGYLKGRRIPMSGAGSIKGDCDIYSEKFGGSILLECKSSAGVDDKGNPRIRFLVEWLTKIRSEAKHTPGCKFGAIVLHFHKFHDDYVIIHSDDYQLLDDTSLVFTTKDFKDQKSTFLTKPFLDTCIRCSTDGLWLHTMAGECILMKIEKFKELIHGEIQSDISRSSMGVSTETGE